MAELDKKIQASIDNIDSATTGNKIKLAIKAALLTCRDFPFPARTIGGYKISDLVTIELLRKLLKGGTLFDAVPTKNSKKAVQSGGIIAYFGDFQDLLKDYNYLSKLEKDK